MKKSLLGAMLLLSIGHCLYAQETDSLELDDEMDTELVDEEERPVKIIVPLDLGKFNYGYFRLSFLRPLGAFNNPMAGKAFPQAAEFSYQGQIPNGVLTLGIESGRVRHINALSLGTPMLKLGINSGFALQAFGPGSVAGSNYDAETIGTYALRLGVGPQLTFKPIKEVRVGLYYRAGIGLAYTSYYQSSYYGLNQEYSHEIDIQSINYAYNGDLGIDASWGILSIGIAYSHMRTQLTKGQVFNINDVAEGFNSYNHYDELGEMESTPINPRLKYNRFAISVGIAF